MKSLCIWSSPARQENEDGHKAKLGKTHFLEALEIPLHLPRRLLRYICQEFFTSRLLSSFLPLPASKTFFYTRAPIIKNLSAAL